MNNLKKESRTHPKIIRISEKHHRFLCDIANETNLPLTKLMEMVLDNAINAMEEPDAEDNTTRI
jgi:hypothetical protein